VENSKAIHTIQLRKFLALGIAKEESQLLLQRVQLIHLVLQDLARFAKLGIALGHTTQPLVHKHSLGH
jgi:hypothetical protein